MTLQTATISSSFTKPDGSPFRLRVTLRAVADSDTVKDLETGQVIAGVSQTSSDVDGTLAVTIPLLPQLAVSPPEAHWRASFEPLESIRGQVAPESIEFDLTGDSTWGELVDVSGTPASETLEQLMAQYRDEALATWLQVQGAASDAAGDAAAAEAARAAAVVARTGAETARTGAETAATTATTKAGDAETARAAAVTARTGAETARTGAETAATTATTKAGDAETAQAAAVVARTGAETARTGAEAAQAAIPALPILAINAVPRPSFEGGAVGWSVDPNATLAIVANDRYVGTQCGLVTHTAATTTQQAVASPPFAIAPGEVWWVSGWVKKVTGPGARLFIDSTKFDVVGSSAMTWSGSSEWTRIYYKVTAKVAGTGNVFFANGAGVGVPSTTSGDSFLLDGVMATKSDYLIDYGDGSQAGWRWAGVAHNSSSELVVARLADLTTVTRQALRQLEGVGSPEGVVMANPGAEYLDTDGTAGAWLWRKRAGTGTTGWKVVDGDTGWRDVSTLMINGWTGQILMRRVGPTIFQRLSALNAGAATSTRFLAVPVGFRPAPGINSRDVVATTALPPALRRTYDLSDVSTAIPDSASAFYYGETSTITDDAWPTSLPGTAV